MFLDFYQMREQPFGVTPDPRFLYLSQSHREALASLFYGVEADRGFIALIAHPGLGKTTLIFHLLEKLQRANRTVFLFQTQCNSRELLQYLLNDLGVDATGMEMVSMHNKLNEVLSREMLAGRRLILAIDEAQNLRPEVLETIRLLSNCETSRAKLLQIVLIGQPQLARTLSSPSLSQLQQRISVFARLEPFGSEDTARYISHRLQIAGYGEGTPFTAGSLQTIYDRTQGIPRNINRMCFSALSLGCAMGRKQIDAQIMREVVADLDSESLSGHTITSRATSSAVKARSVMSHRLTSKSQLRQSALTTACVVSMAFVAVFLPSSWDRISQFLHAKSATSVSVLHATIPSEGSMGATSASAHLPALNEPSVEMPGTLQDKSFPPNSDLDTDTIVVKPGDNLRQIALGNVGQYNNKIVQQMRVLNPAITNPDQIIIGQKIRLFRPRSSPLNAQPLGGRGETNGINETVKTNP